MSLSSLLPCYSCSCYSCSYRSLPPQPISTRKAQPRKRSPQTFAHLVNFSRNVSAMFDNITVKQQPTNHYSCDVLKINHITTKLTNPNQDQRHKYHRSENPTTVVTSQTSFKQIFADWGIVPPSDRNSRQHHWWDPGQRCINVPTGIQYGWRDVRVLQTQPWQKGQLMAWHIIQWYCNVNSDELWRSFDGVT